MLCRVHEKRGRYKCRWLGPLVQRSTLAKMWEDKTCSRLQLNVHCGTPPVQHQHGTWEGARVGARSLSIQQEVKICMTYLRSIASFPVSMQDQ